MNYKPENKQIIISTGSTTTTTKADKYLSLSLHKLMAANKIYKKRINAADRSQITQLNHQQAPQAKPQANGRIMNQKRRTRLSTGYRDMSTGQRAMGPNELASWRRFKTPASRAEPAPRRRELIRTLAICTVLTMLLSTSQCLARDLSQMTFIQSQQSNQQQQLHISSNPYGACKLGAPLQWRPYLDASSKAYLAPVVALASLEHFTLAPIQLTTAGINAVSGSSSASPRGSKGGLSSLANELRLAPQPSLVQHVQSVNNVGVLIEATFKLRTILRRPPIRGLVDLRPGKLISLHYKVSASLATTSDMLALAHSMEQANQTRPPMSGASGQGHTASLRQPTGNECALELSENELSRKGGDLFKLGRDYVLFIEPAASSGINVARKLAPNSNNPRQQLLLHQQQQQQQQVTGWTGAGYGQDHSWSWHAFASHEPASNQTNRSVNRVLCKNCVRPPMVRLVNTTVVSVATTNQQQQQPRDSTTTTKRRIKLDCRVSGNPTPWVEWFRNGKLLRNKSGRTRIRTSPWRGRPNERLSRLELELSSGRNETGVYECRAMSVAAREPAVGTYTLLVLPAQFALFPMLHQTTGNGGNAGRLTNGELGEGGRAQKSATKTNNNKTELASRDGQPGAATPATATANTPAQAAIGAAAKTLNSGGHSDGVTEWAGSTATTTTTTTLAPSTPAQQQQQQQQDGGSMSNNNNSQASSAEATPSKEGTNQSGTPQPHQQQQQPSQATSKGPPSSPVVVGQPCPREAHDNFCLNRGTCVLIGHIDEYFCNCAEGYHGHRCEYKSLGYQINSPNNHH